MENTMFKNFAKSHQVSYREKNIEKDYNKFVTWLSQNASILGNNFYSDFGIFETAKKRYPIKNSRFLTRGEIDVFSDMLRSEHIPLNLFVPLKFDLIYCKNIFNELLKGNIKSIHEKAIVDDNENIKIEFAPSPNKNYLNDGTSFDTYI